MSTTVNENIKNKFFNRITNIEKNNVCADCESKGPTWTSLGFGVFVCLNCSGKHRSLGMHITRVRSIKLDNWIYDDIKIMEKLGNEVANNYYLFENNGKVINNVNIQSKYLNKNYAPKQNQIEEPYKKFIKNPENFDKNFYLNLNKRSNLNQNNEIKVKQNSIKNLNNFDILDFSNEEIKKESNNIKDIDLLNFETKEVVLENKKEEILENKKDENNFDFIFNTNINNVQTNLQNQNHLPNQTKHDKYNFLNQNQFQNQFHINHQNNLSQGNNDKYAIFDYNRRF